MMKKIFIVFAAVVLVSLVGVQAEANLLLSESFGTGYTWPGYPLKLFGADNNWYGGRFDNGGGLLPLDMGMSDDVSPLDGRYGFFDDNAGILIPLDLSSASGNSLHLNFDWSTSLGTYYKRVCGQGLVSYQYEFGPDDAFVAGYYVGSIDDFFLGYKNLYNNGPDWYTDGWTELFRGDPFLGEENWSNQSYSFHVPNDASEVWLAFWMNADDGRYGRVDNINVQATPEPASMLLLGSGLLGLVGLKRRKK